MGKIAKSFKLYILLGLGKTIQAIALILSNPSSDEKRKSTLIVGTVALLHQWKEEILDKTLLGTLKIYSFYGPKRDHGTLHSNI